MGPRYNSCSVVSTSGKLLQHADGAAIDAADAVVRLGWGVVKGFEQHVGKRQVNRSGARTHNPRIARILSDVRALLRTGNRSGARTHNLRIARILSDVRALLRTDHALHVDDVPGP